MKLPRLARKLFPLAVMALATTAGLASASTSIPTTALPVSASNEDINDPQVAVDPSDGDAFYAWVRDEPGAGTLKFIQAVRVSSTGILSTVHTVSTQTVSASSPAIAAAPNGDAIVVWQEFQPSSSDRVIRSTRIQANGTLAATLTLSNPANDVTDPDVGFDGSSNALTVWVNLDGDDAIEARTRINNALGSIEPVASDPGDDMSEPHVAVAPGGDAIISFHDDSGANEQIDIQRRLANGTYLVGLGAGISNSDASAKDQSQVAIDPTGDADAVITWREDTGADNQTLARRIESTEPPTLSGPIRTLSAAGGDADQPQVDMDGSGNAYLTWTRHPSFFDIPQELIMAPDSTLGTTENLNTGLTGDQPDVAVDGNGNATFVWTDGSNVETRGLTSGGTLTPVQPLTSIGSNTEPRVDANAAGARWGAYRVDTAGDDSVYGFFDLTAPSIDTPPVVNPPVATPATPTTTSPAPARKKCKKKRSKKTAATAKNKKCKK